MGRSACLIFNALKHPGIITPTDLVLGITFLHTLGPILWDFDDLCMLFWHDGHRVFSRSIGSTRHDVQSTQCLHAIRSNELAMLDRLHSFEDVFAVPVHVITISTYCRTRPRWRCTLTAILSSRRTS
jgi:hypothetical protein